jgi:hypothetical protein
MRRREPTAMVEIGEEEEHMLDPAFHMPLGSDPEG